MEGSKQEAPSTGRVVNRRLAIRSAAALAGLALVIVAVVAMTRPGGGGSGLPVTQDGGLAWKSTVVHPGPDGARVTAKVDLDGKPFPAAHSGDDPFVMYQLAGGRFDTDEHSNDHAAERTLGFTATDNLLINPRGAGLQAQGDDMPRSGEYTLSLDGSVEYTDIPKGTWELRAYVMKRNGSWDGPLAIRTFTVR